MTNFAVRLAHGPGWDSSRQIRDQEGWAQHAAFMDGLVNDGFIILGGPVGDGEETLHVVEASDEDEIRTRLAADPWAEARLLRIGMIEPGLCGWTADRTNWGLDLRLIASLRGQLRTFTHSAAGNYALSRALI